MARRLYRDAAEAYREENYGTALKKLDEAFELHDAPTILLARAVVLEAMGRQGEAARAYTAYLRRNPSAPDAAKLRRRVEWLEGGGPTSEAPRHRPEPQPRAASAEPRTAERKTPSPGAHLHEGFYLRWAATGGWLYEQGEKQDSQYQDAGLTIGTELFLGGTPAPGLVLAFGLVQPSARFGKYLREYDSDVSVEMKLFDECPDVNPAGNCVERSSSTELAAEVFPVLIDYYPAPRGGFHIQLVASLAGANLARPGASLGAGVGTWSGEETSFDVTARFGAYGGRDGYALWPMVTLGVVYH